MIYKAGFDGRIEVFVWTGDGGVSKGEEGINDFVGFVIGWW